MRICIVLIFIILFGIFTGTHAQEDDASWKDRFDHSGMLKMEWATYLKDGDQQKLELQLTPEFNLDISDITQLTLIGRIDTDLLDHINPGRPSESSIMGPNRRFNLGDRVALELREAYIDTEIGDAYLRLGKQQIVWGKADGLKVLDVVNPQDYTEFILDEFDDSRIPLWALNLEVPIREITAQFIWVPDTTTHRLSEEGAPFNNTANLPTPPPFLRVIQKEADRPNNPIMDSDLGLRLSAFWKGWDLTLNYLYRYDDFPSPARRIQFQGLLPTIIVEPDFHRVHLLGASMSNAFGNLTVRGELAYTVGKRFATDNFMDSNGLVESDEIQAVLGLDWFGFTDWFISTQVFHTHIVNDAKGMVRDTSDTVITLLIRRSFANETIRLDSRLLHNIDDGDGLLRFHLAYDARDNVTVYGGIDYFYGTQNGVFGQFDSNDRFVLGTEIGW